MGLTFKHAPLAEIVAELRWDVADIGVAQLQPAVPVVPVPVLASTALEEFFMRFGGEAFQLNFQRSERLVPPGFPLLPFQATYRYKKQDEVGSEILQVGLGVFTANAVPPYKSWDEFAPIVASGIGALIRSRSAADRDKPFISTSLRYIDLFGAELCRGMSTASFVRDVLGIRIDIPAAVSRVAIDDESIVPFVQLTIPARDSLLMSLTVGEGITGGSQAVILDTTVSTAIPVEPRTEAVMTVLGSARTLIHDMFVAMTKPLHDVMEPSGG